MHFHHSGSSKQAPLPGQVACPACSKHVLEADINAHLDANCAEIPHPHNNGLNKLTHTVKKAVAGWGPVDFGHPEHDAYVKASQSLPTPAAPQPTITNNYLLVSPVLPSTQTPRQDAA